MSIANWIEILCIFLFLISGGIIWYYSKKKIQDYDGLGKIEKKGNAKGKLIGKL